MSGTRFNRSIRTLVIFGTILIGLLRPVWADDALDPATFLRPVPAGIEDLRTIEMMAQQIAEKVVPCTVGLQVGQARGSGVLVSADGYIMTAAHVTGRPGREVLVSFPNGKVTRGKSLGMHTAADIALVKINDDGPWPYVPTVSFDDFPEVGEWCIASGHPRGFQTERTPPIRLGRIVDIRDDVMRTDCPINGGDSGGPLLNSDGHVIGIHSRISGNLTENLHGPVLACLEVWDRLKSGEIYPPLPPSQFLDLLDRNRDGMLSGNEFSDGYYRQLYDRLIERFDLDPKKSYPLEQLAESLNWKGSPTISWGKNYDAQTRTDNSLKDSRFVRGSEVTTIFKELTREAADIAVRIERNDKVVSLGTIVGPDGWILTKATELKDTKTTDAKNNLVCVLGDGRKLPAKLVRTHQPYDLALLKVEATNLPTIPLYSGDKLPLGSWLITIGPKGEPESVGIVSVSARRIVGTPGVLGVEIARSETEAQVVRVFPKSGALAAGIKAKDIITHVFDTEVHNINELRGQLAEKRAGDIVTLKVKRGDDNLVFKVTLGQADDIFFQFAPTQFNGPLSSRRDDFFRAIQHDTVIQPNLCGGPVLDSRGRMVGLNVARADRIATYMVPSTILKSLVVQWTSTEQPPEPQ
ncbi:MAG TPA: hypothetical protein DCE55_00945 [Planctomycetaceae bacterium]|nr:hypothetical protein [Planctomycetaceae bacterium]|tara:strand:- start:19649 stop:21559 length:1911 start_codon:yes stop_codon:yes gene_type:complete